MELATFYEKVAIIRRIHTAKDAPLKFYRMAEAPSRVEVILDGEEYRFFLSGNEMASLFAEFPGLSMDEILSPRPRASH